MFKLNVVKFLVLSLLLTATVQAKESPLINIDENIISVPNINTVLNNSSQKIGEVYNHNFVAILDLPLKETVAFFKEELESKKNNL